MLRLGSGAVTGVVGNSLDVLPQRQVVSNLVGLKGAAQTQVRALVGGNVADDDAFDRHAAVDRCDKAREHIEQSGFARAVGADQAHNGFVQGDGQAVNRFDAAKLHSKVFNSDHGA